MQRHWQAIGRLVGSHLTLIVPIGVAVGVLFPQTLLPLKPTIPTLFAFMTFQNSLSNNLGAMRVALKRPVALLVVIALVHVVAPVLVFAIASLVFGSDSPTTAGVVLANSVPIGASAIMWVGMFEGEVALGLCALLVSSLISPVTIPATIQLLLGATIEVDAPGMMGNMAYMVALPALAATVLNMRTHGWGERVLSPVLMPASRLLLPLIVATNATGISDHLLHLTPQLAGVMCLVLCFVVGGFVLGMVVAGRVAGNNEQRFVAVAFLCGIRNITAGAVLAAQYFGPEVLFPAIMGTPFQQVLAATFGKVMERVLSRRRGRQG